MSHTSTAPPPPTATSILPPAEELDRCSQDGDAVGEGQGADTRQLGVPGEEQSSTRRHHVFQVTWQAQCRMEVGGCRRWGVGGAACADPCQSERVMERDVGESEAVSAAEGAGFCLFRCCCWCRISRRGGIELHPPPNTSATQGRSLADLLLGDGPFVLVNNLL